jgi:hypothetical protein
MEHCKEITERPSIYLPINVMKTTPAILLHPFAPSNSTPAKGFPSLSIPIPFHQEY